MGRAYRLNKFKKFGSDYREHLHIKSRAEQLIAKERSEKKKQKRIAEIKRRNERRLKK